MKKWQPGTHGGTYGGNALACAAGVATIKAMRDENMIENAQLRGEQLVSHLKHLQMEFPIIGDVRGKGLMVATEFRTPDHQPDKPTAKAIVHACEERMMLLLTCGPYDNVIRWIPPLIVNEQQVEDAIGIFTQALLEVVK
jgi:4-aminobutyrate aminotransferase